MSLREQAAADLRAIVEDPTGFGWALTVTDPSEHSAEIVGLSTDVSETLDPGTGMMIAGRRASVALTIASLEEAGFTELPRGIASPSSKPWRVAFADIAGASHEFKVTEARPDRAVGTVICILERYVP